MSSISLVPQNNSLPFTFDLGPEVDLSFYTCIVQTKQYTDSVAGVNKAVVLDRGKFRGLITATEMATLALGHLELIAQLTKTSTDEQTEIRRRFKVQQAFVTTGVPAVPTGGFGPGFGPGFD